jgi:hypothetical protein
MSSATIYRSRRVATVSGVGEIAALRDAPRSSVMTGVPGSLVGVVLRR